MPEDVIEGIIEDVTYYNIQNKVNTPDSKHLQMRLKIKTTKGEQKEESITVYGYLPLRRGEIVKLHYYSGISKGGFLRRTTKVQRYLNLIEAKDFSLEVSHFL